MFIVRIWNYLRGYAIIIVEGLKIERFINLAIVNDIYIWDIKRQSYTTIQAKIGLKNFAKLREIVRKTNSSITITEKCGFPFLLKGIKKKKLLSLGIVMLLVFMYYISSHIWMIEVIGAKNIDKNVVMNNLYIAGLCEGSKKSSIDKRSLENSMLIKMSELSWIGIQIKGTKALVEVVEKKEAPPIISKTDYCDIVASKNAVISKLLVLNGDGLVKDGDTVKVGQKLVSGAIFREGMDTRYVHSMAQVTARTWYEEAEEIALDQIEYKITGNSTMHYKLRILGKDFGNKSKIPFEEYNEYVDEKSILSFGDYIFPIKIIKTKYVELIAVEKKLTEEQAKERCTERLNAKVKLQFPENSVILNKKIDFFVDEKSVSGKITVEILEDIGIKQKIATVPSVE